MYISTTELVRQGLTTRKANNVMLMLAKLEDVEHKTMQKSEPNKRGVHYMHRRNYVCVPDAIKALKKYIKDAPLSGSNSKVTSLPIKRAVLATIKKMYTENTTKN